jgi:hypothetical protein
VLCGVITLVAPIQANLSMAGYLFVLLYYGVAGSRVTECVPAPTALPWKPRLSVRTLRRVDAES